MSCIIEVEGMHIRAFLTRPFRRTWTQTEVRNSDSDSGSDLRNCDFPAPSPKIISQ
jgi:hypothetical protein